MVGCHTHSCTRWWSTVDWEASLYSQNNPEMLKWKYQVHPIHDYIHVESKPAWSLFMEGGDTIGCLAWIRTVQSAFVFSVAWRQGIHTGQWDTVDNEGEERGDNSGTLGHAGILWNVTAMYSFNFKLSTLPAFLSGGIIHLPQESTAGSVPCIWLSSQRETTAVNRSSLLSLSAQGGGK